jgi:hypothetical protein
MCFIKMLSAIVKYLQSIFFYSVNLNVFLRQCILGSKFFQWRVWHDCQLIQSTNTILIPFSVKLCGIL